MFRRINALIWSRKEMLVANKVALINVFMPILMLVVYQYMFRNIHGMKDQLIFMVLPMIPTFIGYLLPTLIAEEAEKNNQRSLRLAGVKSWEYILASLVTPFLVIVAYLFLIPLYLQTNLSDLGWQYVPVMIVTSLTVLFIYLICALLSNTQAQATMGAMPVMMVTMLLPLLSPMDKTVGHIINLTFLGAYNTYRTDLSSYQLLDSSFIILLVWLLASFVGMIWLAGKKQVIKG